MTALPPSNATPDELVGVVLDQRFRIEALLGSGGMAHVYRALDDTTGARVAIKLLKDAIADNAEAAARLRREAELLSRFAHPAIVGIEHVARLPDGRIYLAMEFLEGETLGARMRARKRLSQEELTPILAGAVAGLSVAHQGGVVHRDLKPDNIFLEAHQHGGMQVKLLDFGISKHVGHERLTRTGQVLGTPRYMAPEQLAADKNLDARVDIYALGVILYEALSGNPPFLGASPSELVQAILHGRVTPIRHYVPDLAHGLEVVVHRAMARAKDARYESARDLFDAWLEALGEEPAPRAVAPLDQTDLLGPMGGLPEQSAGASASEPPASFSDFSPGGAAKLDASAVPGERVSAVDTAEASPRARRPRPDQLHAAASAAAATEGRPKRSQASRAQQAKRRRVMLVGLLSGALLLGMCLAGAIVLGWRQLHASASNSPVGAPGAAAPAAEPGGVERAEPAVAAPPAGASAGSADALYAQALAAQRRGDALACTQLAAAALRAGGSGLYHRTEGECYEALGDTLNALKSYERFCAAAPASDPHRARVQATVRAHHGRCD
ncbi:MAG: serine/threonine protein kinase [Myxococcales bacterium]|nr:serine/threonine protein kinase [Myxococcales bacterium]MCB9628592.1 serine/threonine protein kinase [Sandaracinaceae bacterium]